MSTEDGVVSRCGVLCSLKVGWRYTAYIGGADGPPGGVDSIK